MATVTAVVVEQVKGVVYKIIWPLQDWRWSWEKIFGHIEYMHVKGSKKSEFFKFFCFLMEFLKVKNDIQKSYKKYLQVLKSSLTILKA